MACGGCGRAPDGSALDSQLTGIPIVEPDRIVFPERAPEIKGYTLGPDPKELLSNWPGCKHRRTRLMMRRDGQYQIANVCGHPEHPDRVGGMKPDVSPDDCADCPLREPSKDSTSVRSDAWQPIGS